MNLTIRIHCCLVWNHAPHHRFVLKEMRILKVFLWQAFIPAGRAPDMPEELCRRQWMDYGLQ